MATVTNRPQTSAEPSNLQYSSATLTWSELTDTWDRYTGTWNNPQGIGNLSAASAATVTNQSADT